MEYILYHAILSLWHKLYSAQVETPAFTRKEVANYHDS